MNATYYGHACFGVELDGTHILFDPFISPNEKAAHINLDEIPADYILVSHGHQDHMADVEKIAKRTNASIVSNFEVATFFQQKGLQSLPMNHGGSRELPFGTVHYVNAVHSSSFPDGSYAGNPGGFVVRAKAGNFYYSGDTALTYDMKLIPRLGTLDFAFLCIGDTVTMGAKDAATAAEWVGVRKVVGMHYNTFDFIQIDLDEAKQAFTSQNLDLHLPGIGESFEL